MSGFFKTIGKLGAAISQALFPGEFKCIVCAAELNADCKFSVCPECRKDFIFNDKFCAVCGVYMEDEAEFCQTCKDGPRVFESARSACVYDGTARDAVISLKNGNGWLAKELARIMAARFPYPDINFDGCFAIPLDKKRLCERGFNQSILIARELCRLLSKNGQGTGGVDRPVTYIDGLIKIKPTEKQSLLSAKERAENVKGAFALSPSCPPLKEKTLLLIDDVFTTGSTVSECVSVLLKGGAKAAYVYTFAAGKGK